ncbi:MAG: YaaA family protein [Bacteroidaceae bacterium]|nr:YaaA family protein [Bacteroidaceae bacterium]
MQILIACAKIMTGKAPGVFPNATEPFFQQQANDHALQLATYSADELQQMLRVNRALAAENYQRYQSFFIRDTRQPAVFSYDGMVFQKLAPETLTDDELLHANQHLFIGSFLYGLLRPLDLVNPYRLEGDVELPLHGISMFDYWKPVLTDWFIRRVKADDGVLVNLASEEFKNLFDWKRVQKELTVVTPQFKVAQGGRLKTIVIYTKMCRGTMTRWILQHKITDIDALRNFTYEGYRLDTTAGPWMFINQ